MNSRTLPVLIFTALLLFTFNMSFADQHNPKRIMLEKAKQAIDSGEVRLILDMRTKAGLEAENRKIPNSILIKTRADLTKAVTGVDLGELIITYCT